jgi:predicted nucleic acid-binding protein
VLALAWAEANGGVAVMDDQVAVDIARARRLEVRRTLALVAEGVRTGLLDEPQAAELVDALRAGGARFPCTGDEFIQWASDMGLLSPVGGAPDATESDSVAADGGAEE